MFIEASRRCLSCADIERTNVALRAGMRKLEGKRDGDDIYFGLI